MTKMGKRYTNRLLHYTTSPTEDEVVRARLETDSNRAAAKLIGMPRRTLDRTINRVLERAFLDGADEDIQPRILVVDIETAPIKAYVWSLWQNGIGNPEAVIDQSYILSWCAKWVGEDEVFYDALCYNPDYHAGTEDDARMLEGVWNLFDEADIVVAHNGDRFDIKRLNTRFMLAGYPPTLPYKSVDTLKIVKRAFAFDSNKLDNLLREIMGDQKEDAGGFKTWTGCLNGNMDSWEKLIEYNKGDVTKLEKLYLRIRPWDKLHPSLGTWGGVASVPVCSRCGSENVSDTGSTYSTATSVFAVWSCSDCGGKMRTRKSIISPRKRDALLVPVG